MRKLPLNLQILAAPTALAIPIILVLFSTLFFLDDISQQNDRVREWARATDQLKVAKSANYQMLTLLSELSKPSNINKNDIKEELFFSYIEQAQLLKTSLTSSDISDKISEADHFLFTTTLEDIQYSENLNIPATIVTLKNLSPKLDYIYNTLQAKKRGLYVQSNRDITKITSNLTQLILIVLGLAIIFAIFITAFVSANLKKRLSSINQQATNVLQGTIDISNKSNKNSSNDELAFISNKLNKMSLRLNNAIESEKILQAAEDERQRIAMDIHDQFLSEITQLRRDINQDQPDAERQLKTIDATLERLNNELRSLINDLFPHSLEMLGLEAAIRDYINRKISNLQHIDFFIQIDEAIDKYFTPHQSLHIYRIVIEAINNIMKHAHCNRFELVFKMINESLILTIEDNGSGIDDNINLNQANIGILSIKQRASILNTKAIWQASRFSSGTCLKIIFDIKNSKKGIPKSENSTSYA